MSLLISLVFSTIGLVYIKLAHNAGSMPLAMLGLALFGYSYFIESAIISFCIGAVLTILGILAAKSN